MCIIPSGQCLIVMIVVICIVVIELSGVSDVQTVWMCMDDIISPNVCQVQIVNLVATWKIAIIACFVTILSENPI